MTLLPLDVLPRIPLGAVLEDFFDLLTDNLDPFFDAVKLVVGTLVEGLTWVLVTPPALLMAVLFALVGAVLKGWKFGLGSLIGLLLIVSMQEWTPAMQTLSVVLVSAAIAIVIAIPLGILAARKRGASHALRPIMDLMQTMPAFVWLVPVVTLFSIGFTPAVVATIIFALPPGVRLTELGIRNVDPEIVEAANAFGATPRQTLFGVQLPLALPTIMAGVNQVIMLSLSMAVIAGLVGAGGLGGQVTAAIATLDLGLGFEGGISVVILAIFLDRVTATIGQGGAKGGVLGKLLGRRSQQNAAVADVPDSPEVEEPSPEIAPDPDLAPALNNSRAL